MLQARVTVPGGTWSMSSCRVEGTMAHGFCVRAQSAMTAATRSCLR